MGDFIDQWGIPNRPDHDWNEYDLLRVWQSGHVEMTQQEEREFLVNPLLQEVLKFNQAEIVNCLGFSSNIEDALMALNEIDLPVPEEIMIETTEPDE